MKCNLNDYIRSSIILGINDQLDALDIAGSNTLHLEAGKKTVVRAAPSVFRAEKSAQERSPEMRDCRFQDEQLRASKVS